jgi:hypothetical protein
LKSASSAPNANGESIQARGRQWQAILDNRETRNCISSFDWLMTNDEARMTKE